VASSVSDKDMGKQAVTNIWGTQTVPWLGLTSRSRSEPPTESHIFVESPKLRRKISNLNDNMANTHPKWTSNLLGRLVAST